MLHLGQTSVALFFMITAFLFWGRVLAQGERMDWPAMLFARLYRLYPVYLLMPVRRARGSGFDDLVRHNPIRRLADQAIAAMDIHVGHAGPERP